MKKFLPLLLLVSSFFTTSAYALGVQTHSGLSSINAAIRGGKGTVNAVGTGAIVTSKGDVLVQPSGLVVPVTGKATISAGKIIGGVIGCIPPLTTIGAGVCAASVALIASELAGTDYAKCALGDTGFCKQTPALPEGQGDPNAPGWYGQGAACSNFGCTLKQACESQIPIQVGPLSTYEYDRAEMESAEISASRGYKASANCFAHRIDSPQAKYAGGLVLSQQVYKAPAGGTAPATADDIAEALARRQAQDAETSKRILDAQNKDIQANPTSYPKVANPYTDDTPYEVIAPPVTGPAEVVETKTYTNPDGSTSTETKTEKTTVNPTTSGSTLGTSKTGFPTSTTTTVTTTNNTTNITTTGPTTVTNSPSVPAEKTDFPDDYNREATQQKILKTLDGSDVPDGSEIDKDSDLKKIQDKNDEMSRLPMQITETSLGIFWWMPDVPSAECVNPQVPNMVGQLLEVDICKPFNYFKLFISAVMVYFCVVASVREVQAAVKAT
jgi:hypothetical protein